MIKHFVRVIALVALLTGSGISNLGAEPELKRLKIDMPATISLNDKIFKVANVDAEQFVDLFGNIATTFNEDSKGFGAATSTILTKTFNLEDNESADGVFSMNPMFNRDILITTIMVSNKIRLDAEDFDRLAQTFATYGREAKDDKEKLLIATIYGTLFAEWKDGQ